VDVGHRTNYVNSLSLFSLLLPLLFHFYSILDLYTNLNTSEKFATLKGIRQLAKKMVEMKNDIVYPLIYLL
jgi:hypothetical protein